MEILNYNCIGCLNRCRVEVQAEARELISIAGNRCKRGIELARRRLITPPAPFALPLRIVNGAATHIEARTSEPVPPDVARAVTIAVRKLSFSAPIQAGTVLVQNVGGMGVDLIAVADATSAAPSASGLLAPSSPA